MMLAPCLQKRALYYEDARRLLFQSPVARALLRHMQVRRVILTAFLWRLDSRDTCSSQNGRVIQEVDFWSWLNADGDRRARARVSNNIDLD
jgi:hypothetical protein